MYEEYKADIDKMRKMVASLNAFHDHTHALDTNHQNQMKNFHDAIQSLFSNAGTFTGSAANTLQDIAGKYEQTERSFDGGTGGSSPHLTSATDACTASAKNLQHFLDEFDTAMSNYNNKLINFVGENVVQQEAALIANSLVGGPYAGIPLSDVIAYSNGECVYPPETQFFDADLQREKTTWDYKMDGVASDPLPALPAVPTNPAPFKPDPNSILYPSNSSISQNSLTPQQQRTAQELYTEFGGGISLNEIEQMIKDHPQWSKDKLRQELLRKQLREGKGYVGQLVGATLNLSGQQKKTLTAADIEAMIKAGYTNTHFAVLLGLRPLSDATTPAGRQLTWHALADSITRHGVTLTEIDAIIDDPSRISTQSDGGKAYIKKAKQGYSLVIVSSTGGIVTALKNLNPVELKRLGRNYGFNPNP